MKQLALASWVDYPSLFKLIWKECILRIWAQCLWQIIWASAYEDPLVICISANIGGVASIRVAGWFVWEADTKIDLGCGMNIGCPGRWLSSKESACKAGATGSIPGSGRSPEEGNVYPLQYSCLENPMDRGAWRATVHGVGKSQTLSRHAWRWATPRALHREELELRLSSSLVCQGSVKSQLLSGLVCTIASGSHSRKPTPASPLV